MADWVDVSLPLSASTPVWPGNDRFHIKWSRHQDCGGATNDSIVTFDLHTGTHVEGPLHVDSAGRGPDHLPVDHLTITVTVVEIDTTAGSITREVLPPLDDVKEGVLLKTRNSSANLLNQPDFVEDFCGLEEGAAETLANISGLRAVGIDYLSIQSRQASNAVHEVFLQNSILIIEGLDLRDVSAGTYDMVCLPLLIKGAEAAPCRVMLKRLECPPYDSERG